MMIIGMMEGFGKGEAKKPRDFSLLFFFSLCGLYMMAMAAHAAKVYNAENFVRFDLKCFTWMEMDDTNTQCISPWPIHFSLPKPTYSPSVLPRIANYTYDIRIYETTRKRITYLIVYTINQLSLNKASVEYVDHA